MCGSPLGLPKCFPFTPYSICLCLLFSTRTWRTASTRGVGTVGLRFRPYGLRFCRCGPSVPVPRTLSPSSARRLRCNRPVVDLGVRRPVSPHGIRPSCTKTSPLFLSQIPRRKLGFVSSFEQTQDPVFRAGVEWSSPSSFGKNVLQRCSIRTSIRMFNFSSYSSVLWFHCLVNSLSVVFVIYCLNLGVSDSYKVNSLCLLVCRHILYKFLILMLNFSPVCTCTSFFDSCYFCEKFFLPLDLLETFLKSVIGYLSPFLYLLYFLSTNFLHLCYS